MHSPLNS